MASDGAFEYSEKEATSSFALSLDESVGEISSRVLARAKEAREGKPNDDITVIALRLKDNS
jgi:serine phosphatase RsbU (regulator of sigma subunit)